MAIKHYMKEVMRVILAPEKARKVRQFAMARYGFRKGAISKAVNAALDIWMEKPEKVKRKPAPDWRSLEGALSDIKMTSVELQHEAFSFHLPKK